MHLEKQIYVINRFKETIMALRVKNNRSSMKKGRLICYTNPQIWQHGIVKTTNGLQMMYNDLKMQYGIHYIRTSKLNQACEKYQSLNYLSLEKYLECLWISD